MSACYVVPIILWFKGEAALIACSLICPFLLNKQHITWFRLHFPVFLFLVLIIKDLFCFCSKQVRELETDPVFNSGRGSVLTEKGTVEMEASIMDGPKRRCGSVSGVTTVKNPISLARLVMDKSPHSYLAFNGAEEFARQQVLFSSPIHGVSSSLGSAEITRPKHFTLTFLRFSNFMSRVEYYCHVYRATFSGFPRLSPSDSLLWRGY